MKKTIGILSIMFGFTVAQASDGHLFKANEWDLSIFGGWVDKEDSKFAPGVSATYFMTKHLGLGGSMHLDNYDGTMIDNLSAEGYFRLPLGRLPLAPYGVAQIGYNFETEEVFEALGAGVEWRFNRKWGAFGDVRWQFNNDTIDGVALRVGARMRF